MTPFIKHCILNGKWLAEVAVRGWGAPLQKNLLGTECAIGANTLWYYYYYIIKVAHLIKPTAWLTLIDPGRVSCICVGASWGP